MDEPKFHTVEPEFLQHISIEQIQAQHNSVLKNADYSIPVPIENQTIPRRENTGNYYVSIIEGMNPIVKPELDAPYRGRIGGC